MVDGDLGGWLGTGEGVANRIEGALGDGEPAARHHPRARPFPRTAL